MPITNIMQQLESQLQRIRMPKSTQPGILVIGGAEDKVHGREILQTFFRRAGGTNARLAIIPSASREPSVIGSRYQRIFEDMGAEEIRLLDIRNRSEAENKDLLEYLEICTGVFMTGGDQLRLCGLLADTPVMEKVRQRVHQSEITLAGTSAGAAVMGHHMIAGGGSGEFPNRSLVDITMGLGIIPEVIVDQHFYHRNRMARLITAISEHPDRLAIGIDEDTCALFEKNGWLQVMGKGTVTIIDPQEMSYTNQPKIGHNDPISIHNLRVHILCHGDRYHFQKRSLFAGEN